MTAAEDKMSVQQAQQSLQRAHFEWYRAKDAASKAHWAARLEQAKQVFDVVSRRGA